MSEADFERQDTDVEDSESYYIEEDVTDDEAMKLQAMNTTQEKEEGDDSDDSDFIGYMPTAMAKTKSKPTKIMKTIKTKKKKTNKKRPPKSNSKNIRVPSPGKPVLSDSPGVRKSYTMSGDQA